MNEQLKTLLEKIDSLISDSISYGITQGVISDLYREKIRLGRLELAEMYVKLMMENDLKELKIAVLEADRGAA